MALTFGRTWDGSWPGPLSPEPDFAQLTGPAAWSRLHPDVRRRFAAAHGALPVVYEGRMTLRRSPAAMVFALLSKAFGGPLPLRSCDGASALVQVRADGHGGIVWERWLRFPGQKRAVCIRSTKRLDADGSLLECIDGGLGMVLQVFEECGALIFESRKYFLQIGGTRVPLPGLLTPGTCRVAHRAAGPATFEFTLRMDHPLLGRTFSQSGIFCDPEAAP